MDHHHQTPVSVGRLLTLPLIFTWKISCALQFHRGRCPRPPPPPTTTADASTPTTHCMVCWAREYILSHKFHMLSGVRCIGFLLTRGPNQRADTGNNRCLLTWCVVSTATVMTSFLVAVTTPGSQTSTSSATNTHMP